MIFPEQIPELSKFYSAEKRVPVWPDPTWADLVVASRNQASAVHRWFRYKESFAPDLVKTVVREHFPELGKLRLLDPFCGVGTTLLSAQELASEGYAIEAEGIECNPFVAFVAQAKLAWSEIEPEELLRLGARCMRSARPAGNLPVLSSIRTGRCITTHMARWVVSLRDEIFEKATGAHQQALLLGLAGAVEPLSKTRKDGRALRLVEKPRTSFKAEVELQWETIAADVIARRASYPKTLKPKLHVGDGRDVGAVGIKSSAIDLIVTSPPYPNNIDYNEVYKLELWLLGFAKTAEEFLHLRRQTFRSHPTCDEPDEPAAFVEALTQKQPLRLLGPLLARVDAHPERWRRKVLRGYLSDLWRGLTSYLDVLKPGGKAALVVGNSLHGQADFAYLIPTDLAIAVLAEAQGFETESVIVARPLRRRLATNHFLRESIVVLRKPAR